MWSTWTPKLVETVQIHPWSCPNKPNAYEEVDEQPI